MASHQQPAQFLRLVALSILFAAGAAQADPVAFVVNADSNSVSVVDLTREIVRANLSVWDGGSPNATREPKDALVDPRSGRLFVASRERLVSFDGRLADGRGRFEVAAQDEGSGLALDEPGRRIFMSHEQLGNYPNGVVTEFSIANPAAPVWIAEHEIAGVPDLRFIAWDPKYRRLYVVDDDGVIARTGAGNLALAPVAGAGAPNPGGIVVDPAGGVWVSSRGPGKLVRIAENGARSEVVVPNAAQQPRGLAWKQGQILVAVDDIDKVRRFNPATGVWADEMTTGDRPQDVGVTQATTPQAVSANRRALDGSVSVANREIATTQEKSIALAVVEVARLTPDPSAHSFCWNRAGDTDAKTFSVQNTRIDRLSVDLGTLTRGGSNPGNYSVVSDGCSAARLKWGAVCQFRLGFTASGPSIQPPSPWGGVQIAKWPAQVSISSTDNSATATISLQGSLNLNPCYPLPIPRLPLAPIGGL